MACRNSKLYCLPHFGCPEDNCSFQVCGRLKKDGKVHITESVNIIHLCGKGNPRKQSVKAEVILRNNKSIKDCILNIAQSAGCAKKIISMAKNDGMVMKKGKHTTS